MKTLLFLLLLCSSNSPGFFLRLLVDESFSQTISFGFAILVGIFYLISVYKKLKKSDNENKVYSPSLTKFLGIIFGVSTLFSITKFTVKFFSMRTFNIDFEIELITPSDILPIGIGIAVVFWIAISGIYKNFK